MDRCNLLGGGTIYPAGVGTGTGPGNNRYLYGIGAWDTVWSGGTTYTPWRPIQPLDNPGLGLTTSATIVRDPDSTTYYATVLLIDSGDVSSAPITRCTIYTSTDLVTWTPFAALGSLFQYRAFTVKLGGHFYV